MDKMSTADLYQEMSNIGLGGWIADSEGDIIKEEVDKIPHSGVYLEVGVAFGKSLATVCYYADTSIDIYGIDVLNWREREQNMEKLGVKGRYSFIEGDSQQEALNWKKPIDLLFIDADHTYYGVIKDLLSWTPNVKPGGRIMMHDYDQTSPGVMRAIHDFVFPHPGYSEHNKPERPNTIYRFTKK